MAQLNQQLVNLLGFRAVGDLGPVTMYQSQRNRRVWYAKAPPEKPPSYLQLMRRNRWRQIAWTWRQMTTSDRNNWTTLAAKAKLRMGGYQLYLWWADVGEKTYLDTIMHQADYHFTPPQNATWGQP